MNRNNKIVLTTAIGLVLIIIVFAWLNRGSILAKKAVQDSESFSINAGGQSYTVAMDSISALNPQEIDGNYTPSGKTASVRQYMGVPLKSIFDSLHIDYSNAGSVSFTAVDGYASAISAAEALDEGNCFIVFEENGKPLGTEANGGSGPFMMILAKDQYSQRWCKFLMEITLK